MRRTLAALVQRIELDPANRTFECALPGRPWCLKNAASTGNPKLYIPATSINFRSGASGHLVSPAYGQSAPLSLAVVWRICAAGVQPARDWPPLRTLFGLWDRKMMAVGGLHFRERIPRRRTAVQLATGNPSFWAMSRTPRSSRRASAARTCPEAKLPNRRLWVPADQSVDEGAACDSLR